MSTKQIVLIDNSVVDKLCSRKKPESIQYVITARTNIDNPEYLEKYKELKIIPSLARFGHSVWDGGEVWGSEETTRLSNELLALGASQRNIKEVGKQTSRNQRDDADIMTAAFINNCSILVSDDKKFILKSDVVALMKNYGVTILSVDAFISGVLEKIN